SGTRIHVAEGGSLPYTIASASPVQRWTIIAHYGPFAIPVADEAFQGSTETVRTGEAALGDIARYGKGLYDVTADALLADGTHCNAGFQLEVSGPLLTSVLGIAAVALLGVGLAGLVGILVNIALQVND